MLCSGRAWPFRGTQPAAVPDSFRVLIGGLRHSHFISLRWCRARYERLTCQPPSHFCRDTCFLNRARQYESGVYSRYPIMSGEPEFKRTNISVPDRPAPTPPNATLLQAFEWYTSAGGKHLDHLGSVLEDLSGMGVTALWIPRNSDRSTDKTMLTMWSMLQSVIARGQRVRLVVQCLSCELTTESIDTMREIIWHG